MRLAVGRFELSFTRKAAAEPRASGLTYPDRARGGWHTIVEPFAGAWQRGIVAEDPKAQLLRFGSIFACMSLVAGDIGRMRPMLQIRQPSGTWVEVDDDSRLSRLVRKPHPFYTWGQFLESWVTSRLMWGNVYLLKERREDGAVGRLHLLSPELVAVKLTPDGGVYYQLNRDVHAAIEEPILVPASEIAHDRTHCFFHPLIGLSALSAAAASGTFGRRIQEQSCTFFANASQPGGHLTAEGNIPDETAERLKRDFEDKFAGGFIGRLLVTGSGLKYEPLAMPAHDAQLIEQLRWTGEDCCRVFKIPGYKVGVGPLPSFNNIAQLQNDYLGQALQPAITAIELLMAEALELPPNMRIELDTSALLRMDPLSRAETAAKLVGAGILSPNEARAAENLPPVRGGDQPFMQQQMWQVGQLASRTAPSDAPTSPPAKDWLARHVTKEM
ncbi:phage portal protein [Piscinibacter defluvii]|uniref:phage portal protein n=1 Tax=Piscinibacter defluvii TaxID=1796922 RepID=UPI000FDEBA85|nr:phage portal protein [Piscinibacter defluvii]